MACATLNLTEMQFYMCLFLWFDHNLCTRATLALICCSLLNDFNDASPGNFQCCSLLPSFNRLLMHLHKNAMIMLMNNALQNESHETSTKSVVTVKMKSDVPFFRQHNEENLFIFFVFQIRCRWYFWQSFYRILPYSLPKVVEPKYSNRNFDVSIGEKIMTTHRYLATCLERRQFKTKTRVGEKSVGNGNWCVRSMKKLNAYRRHRRRRRRYAS